MYSARLRCTDIRHRRSIYEGSSSNHSYNSSSYDYDEESIPCNSVFFLLEFFHAYYIPAIILLGIVGNLLSCIVFLNTHLKMRSSSYYLAALAVTDLTFLVTLLFVWLNSELNWRVFNVDGWCEILVYVSAVCSSLSVWLIVAFTVERFIAIQYPLHRPQMCTISRAKTTVCLLVLLSLVCHSYAFITAGVVRVEDGDYCDLKREYLEVMKVISTVDSIASLIVPIVLIVVMNAMIMRNLLKFSRRFKQTPMASLVTSNQCPSRGRSDINLNQIPSKSSSHNGIPLAILKSGKRAGSQRSFHSSRNSHSHQSTSGSGGPVVISTMQPANVTSPALPSSSAPRNISYQMPDVGGAKCIGSSSKGVASTRNQQSITKMLLLISTVFILLNLPSYIIRLCIFFFTLTKRDSPDLLWCLQQFFMVLYYTNFSINFLLYAMCGVTFRRCLQQLVQKAFKSVTRYIERQRRHSDSS